VVCVVLHASGTPNPPAGSADQCRCLSFAQAEALGWDITAMREDYTVAVEAFPDDTDQLARAWSELQFNLRDRLEATGDDFVGSTMFCVVFFEADGRIARFVHRGLELEQQAILCDVVEELADGYRFPLKSDSRFSQCGTTHFSNK
jgi:hypothetical protein